LNAGYGITAAGDPNNNVNAVLNLPFGDNFALRGVIFTDHHGGYISNVSDTISVPGVPPLQGPIPRPGSPPAPNAGVVGSNLNTVQYGGARLSALYKFSDDWTCSCSRTTSASRPTATSTTTRSTRTAAALGAVPDRGLGPGL